MLESTFFRQLGTDHMYPAIHTCSPFIHASGFSARRFFEPWYHTTHGSPLLNAIQDRESFSVISERLLEQTSREIFLEHLRGSTVLERRRAAFEQEDAAIDAFYRESIPALNVSRSEHDFTNSIATIRNRLWSQNAAVFFSLHFDRDFAWKLLQEAQYPLSYDDFSAIWDRAIVPCEASFDVAQLLDVAEGRAAGYSWDAIGERCRYIGGSNFDIKSSSEMAERLAGTYHTFERPEDAQRIMKETRNTITRETLAHAAWKKTLSPEQQHVVTYIQTIIPIRDRRKNFFFKGLTIIWRMTERLFQQAAIDPALIPYETMDELIRESLHQPHREEELLKRKNGFVTLIDLDGHAAHEYTSYHEVKQTIDATFRAQHAPPFEKAHNELKGNIAFKGVVRGRARIVLDVDQTTDFVDGDILIAGMTRPEYVPLMRRASAIVTDEGGITCHAAIISRELQKPCIIATKLATHLLHDGDEIEVDAIRGVVRILKSTTPAAS